MFIYRCAGVCVLMLEATFLFLFLDIGKWLDSKSEQIRHWQKMALYFALCIPSPMICGSATAWVGSLGFLMGGMAYMVLTIGPKGDGGSRGGAGTVPYGRKMDDLSVA
eukprot:sb/3477554/